MVTVPLKVLSATVLSMALCGCATAEESKPIHSLPPGVEWATTPDGKIKGVGGTGAAGFAPPTSAMPISAYIVNLSPTVFKSKKNKEIQLEPQLLFIDDANAKKAFEMRDEIQKIVASTVEKSKVDLKSPAGKFLIKGEIMAKLNEAGYEVEGVLWNRIRF